MWFSNLSFNYPAHKWLRLLPPFRSTSARQLPLRPGQGKRSLNVCGLLQSERVRERRTMVQAAAVAISAILVLAVALWFGRNGKRSPKLPPGSMGWPLVGEAPSFLKRHPPFVLGEFMSQRLSRFGNVFTTNLFGSPTIVSTDPELNAFVLKNDFRLFELGWPSVMLKVLGEFSPGLQVGDAHRRIRSTILGFLSPTRIRTVFLEDSEWLADLVFSSWKDGSVVFAKHEAMKFTFNIMVKNLISMTPGEPETEKLGREFQSFLVGFMSVPLNLPGTAFRKALQSRSNILKVIKQKMVERMQNKVNNIMNFDQGDFLDWLTENTDYSEEQIGDTLLGLLFGGHDTTARAITLAIYFLHGCPEALKQLREEHLQVLRSKEREMETRLTWDDYKQMKFTQCVINETLRLGNVAKFVLRRAVTDVQFKEHEIPRGCNVIVHFAAPHLDSSLFEDAKQFNPWRWMSSSYVHKANNFMPFGGGTRFCLGAELARLEMNVFLHRLVLNYTWKIIDPERTVARCFSNRNGDLPIKVHVNSSDS